MASSVEGVVRCAVMERWSAPVRGVVSSVRRSRQMLTMVVVQACWYRRRSCVVVSEPFIGVECEVGGCVDVEHEVASGASCCGIEAYVGGWHSFEVDDGHGVLPSVCVGDDSAHELALQCAAECECLVALGFVAVGVAVEDEDGVGLSLIPRSAASEGFSRYDVVCEDKGLAASPVVDDVFDAFDTGACAGVEAVVDGESVFAQNVLDVLVNVDHGSDGCVCGSDGDGQGCVGGECGREAEGGLFLRCGGVQGADADEGPRSAVAAHHDASSVGECEQQRGSGCECGVESAGAGGGLQCVGVARAVSGEGGFGGECGPGSDGHFLPRRGLPAPGYAPVGGVQGVEGEGGWGDVERMDDAGCHGVGVF